MSMNYFNFLEQKRLKAQSTGFDVSQFNSILYDFQRDLTRWALRKGRAAIFADCGLGKTLIQLEWASHVGKETSKPVLIVSPLSVAEQTIFEASKLNMDVKYVREPQSDESFQITNYDILHKFRDYTDLYSGIVLDESSILKSLDGKTRKLLLDHFTSIHYRLCCTATPCPNDVAEIANHAQFLGVMQRQEILACFFVHDDEGWRLRGHAATAFYRWLASWAICMKSPSDLNYDGSRFILPPLIIKDEILETKWRRPGKLFPGDLKGITDRTIVRKQSIQDRTKRTIELVNDANDQMIIWCGLNEESINIKKFIPDSIEVSGTMDLDMKRQAIRGFLDGSYRVLITKIKICGFGLNFQNVNRMIFFGLGDSYEQYYQGIRRCWRYGQKMTVYVHVVVTDHEIGIVDNIRRKERDSEMLSSLIINASKEYEMEELGLMKSHVEVLEQNDYRGQNWTLLEGDCVERMVSLRPDSVSLSVFSPPFLSLYTYSATERDLGNSKNPEEFFTHLSFVISELLRITKPGRLACVHVAQVSTTLVTHGVIGLKDFRGQTITAFVDSGFVYHGEVCIDKDPQAQAIRTHSKALLFIQLKKDASWLRPAMADYILVFRKPGVNEVPIHPDIDNETWIEWARPIWYGIRESNTLNVIAARSESDDRHICPLQLGVIERCIRLWSNPGELIFSPFAGIGSEGYEAIRLGRMFLGIELKHLYAECAVKNLNIASQSRYNSGRLFNVETETKT